MKKFALCLSILATIFTSCSTSDDEGTVQPVEGEITGSATTNRTFAFGNYTSCINAYNCSFKGI